MGSQEQKNLVLAIVLSVAILFSFQLLAPPPPPPPQSSETSQTATPGAEGVEGVEVPGADVAGAPGTAPEVDLRDRTTILENTARVAIATPRLTGSISLDGGRLDDLILTGYRETLAPNSPQIQLLQPQGTFNAYFATFGWVAGEAGLAVPTPKTRWEAAGAQLAPGRPVTLSWDNGAGLRFERIFEVDEDYLFTITQRIVNTTGQAVAMKPFGAISRRGTPDTLGFYILHEGPLGVLEGELKELGYDDDLKEEAQNGRTTLEYGESLGGWLGITDKYWLVALIPDTEQPFNGRFLYTGAAGFDKYQADFEREPLTVPAGGEVAVTSHLFAGAKIVELIDAYEAQLGIDKFDRAVDFGWFYFLTKPLFNLLHWFFVQLGNFGLAILALTVVIKLIFFPLANKSYRSMAKMRTLQPDMVKLRERFSDDRQRLNQEMMELYKREKVNPMAGCLPILIQIPVFFALYKVLFVTIEMRHAPFYGWVQDLSAADPTSILNGFGLLPWGIPDLGFFAFFSIGIWPLLMGLTMFLQTKLNPQPADPVQARIFTWMPVIFMFLLATFPAGLVIYWTWNNVLSIIQQYVIMRRAGVPIGGTAPPIQLPGMKPPEPAEEEAKPEEAEPEKEAPARAAQANGGTTRSAQKKKRRGKKKRAARAENGAAPSDSTRQRRRSEGRDGKAGQADRPDGD